MKDMDEKFNYDKFLTELWKSFEKTGSISAFLLYNDLRKKNGKDKEIRIKKADIEN
ncbi:MAG: YqzL family protein [Candidatus Goldbacteria bacterium]|nr:YqzL family protein [Candidatus Goldiibacteriota bacterium]